LTERSLVTTVRPVRVALHTLGCRTNQAELAGFRQAIADADPGVEFVPWDEQADVYLLHSCTVTARADRQCRQKVHQAHRHAPDARIVISGCYAERDAHALAGLPGVQAVIGCMARGSVVSEVLRRSRPADGGGRRARVDEPAPAADPRRTRATLKIQEGCDHRCTYCVVPSVRGSSRSSTLQAVLAGAQTLVAAGHPEVVLTGTHIGRWGKDLTPRATLADLLDELAGAMGDARLRLSSLDPREITSPLLDKIAADPRICRHLHLSMQHTDPGILAAMGRPSAPVDVVMEAAQVLPRACIGADIIAGFPGETAAAFEQLTESLESLPLAYLHVFGYSTRPGTAAADLPGRLSRDELSARVAALRALSDEQMRPRFLRGLIGRDLDVVVERTTAIGIRGVSSEFATVEAEGSAAAVGSRIGVRVGDVEGSVATGVLL